MRDRSSNTPPRERTLEPSIYFAAVLWSQTTQRPSSRIGRGPLTCGDVGGAEGTRTPDPLVANSGHGGRPGVSEQGSGRSKAKKPRRSQWRCCTSLLYFLAPRT
jgi:hypothetical protein